MKVIRTTENLPKSFDITKYKDMDKLNPFEWLCLLGHRDLVYSNACYLSEKDKYSEDELNFMLDCDPREEIENILKSPLDIFDSLNTIKYMRDWNIDDLDRSIIETIDDMTVTDLTVWDFHHLVGMNHSASYHLKVDDNEHIPYPVAINFMDYCSEAEKQFNEYSGRDNDGESWLKTLLRGRYPVCINPYSNDEQLVEDLLCYVERLREKLNINPQDFLKVSLQDLQRWASYQLLPIIDLQIWAKVHSIRITNTVICVSVFPTGLYGESNLSKSIQPIINDLLDQENFSKLRKALSRLVANEVWKDSSKYFPENKWIKTDWNEFMEKFIAHWLPIKHQEKS